MIEFSSIFGVYIIMNICLKIEQDVIFSTEMNNFWKTERS